MRRSEKILQRPDFSFNRSVYKSMGFSNNDLRKPMIGIANSWSELVPGSYSLKNVGEAVKRGILAAGGTPVEFGIIGACDGTAQGNEGMKYILPTRDCIANDVETMVQAHQLDGIVLLGSCDKIVPGLLMAAARLDLPAIVVPAGPMLGGREFDGRPSDLTSMSEGCGMLKAGKIGEDELNDLEDSCGPTCGSCSFYGTANTMCCVAEALGMVLTGGALIPAVYAERTRMAAASGEAIVNLVNKGITSRDIINEKSLENAIRVLNATGGSTNGVLHLLAIARELGISSTVMLDKFKKIGESTPLVAKVNPASKYNMEDFYHAGGIPQVMREIEEKLNVEVMTVSSNTLAEELNKKTYGKINREVIKTMDEPFSTFGGIAIVEGNLAPNGGITKPSAIKKEMHLFKGVAKCFNSEEEAEEAILAKEIQPNDVLVIRYEGPKGGPGMREMYKAMKYLYGLGLAESTAIITDGRFSGTNNGCFVGHISPEASECGPIALVEDGDEITINIPCGEITLHVDDETLSQRKQKWVKPKKEIPSGILRLYAKLASSANEGASMVIDEEE
ncbi:MAG: dihydroxy-acid dehydratase [Anaerorhabdus sp.]|uniref:dihydroxy-acid dehydratase n=2 Tax=Anaerorhabdus sp. TaxID=1872524 RepID=UPI002B2123CE|nr:dihydroxy-acid dehydratase [Anaerorhabdus sp.]MEA4875582.1 dihydroxy-acid dehydratase [Anaerorhabdus sp.]